MGHAAFKRLMTIIKYSEDFTIPVEPNAHAIVDAADYGFLARRTWRLAKGYATTRINGKLVFMHRHILKPGEGELVDHRNGDKLDNRRSNIRVCNSQDNARNRFAVTGKSRFKGVRNDRGIWRAQIKIDQVTIHLGCFDTELSAAKAYDKAALLHFGEFAKTNKQLGLY